MERLRNTRINPRTQATEPLPLKTRFISLQSFGLVTSMQQVAKVTSLAHAAAAASEDPSEGPRVSCGENPGQTREDCCWPEGWRLPPSSGVPPASAASCTGAKGCCGRSRSPGGEGGGGEGDTEGRELEKLLPPRWMGVGGKEPNDLAAHRSLSHGCYKAGGGGTRNDRLR